MATKDKFTQGIYQGLVQYKENKCDHRINNDIQKQEERQVVCQPVKSQGKQSHEEKSGELNSPQINSEAYSKCSVDSADTDFTKA